MTKPDLRLMPGLTPIRVDRSEQDVGGPGGPGDNGGMDRLEHLEKRVDTIDGRLGRIERDVDALKGDVSTLKSDVNAIKTTLSSIDAKLDIGSIRASVEKAHTDIYKWIVSIIAVVGAIYFGLQKVSPTMPAPGYPPNYGTSQHAAPPAPAGLSPLAPAPETPSAK